MALKKEILVLLIVMLAAILSASISFLISYFESKKKHKQEREATKKIILQNLTRPGVNEEITKRIQSNDLVEKCFNNEVD